MTAWQWLIAAWAGLGSLAWVFVNLRGYLALVRLPSLASRVGRPAPENWPSVSVVVAACNEGETIGSAAETLLALDYPDLEIVIVDDRSTDRTGAVIDELAARDARVRTVHVTELPDGWLGKVHALSRGVEVASGQWLLFCDADIHLAPEALRRAVALAEDDELDQLPVLPLMEASGFVLEATICCFGAAYLFNMNANKLRDPDSDAYAGVGAFNLVRAETLRRSEGLEWLRMEIADDVGIGLLIKRAGGRTGMALGGGAVRVTWYDTVAAMTAGLEKNMFAVVGQFSVARTLARVLALGTLALAPLVALALPLSTFAWLLPVACALTLLLFARAVARRLGQRLGPAIAQPLGIPVLGYMFLRSAWRCWRRGGVVWRGQFYSLDVLRRGQRVKI